MHYAVAEHRPRRVGALGVEHAGALQRVIAVPPIVVPAKESHDAYVRRADGITYICPWETRLRSWLAFERFRADTLVSLSDMFVPQAVADHVSTRFADWQAKGGDVRPHILSSTWQIPLPWFVPFLSKERWLVLGDTRGEQKGDQAEPAFGGPTTTTPTRTLIYVTPMADARRRVARALLVIKRSLGEGFTLRGQADAADRQDVGFELAHGAVETVGRWLEAFHPHSLVELDYGGLVHLIDDDTLRTDESVAEVAAALTGMDTGQAELAVAMYKRVAGRWRGVRALESAN
jgi:hypothetical protein